MSVLTRYNGGKRYNLIQRGSFQCRSYLSALRYNKGFNWHNSPWKYLKSYMVAQTKYKKKLYCDKEKTTNRRKTIKKPDCKKTNVDYGPLALKVELSPKQMDDECSRLLKNLEITSERKSEIASNTIGQFDNILYRSERSERLTASNFGAVIKRRDATSCNSLVKQILVPQYFHSDAIEYGKLNEAVAISILEDEPQVQIKPSGFFIDLVYPFLGASRDGLIGDDRIVEVKCLLKVPKLGISLKEAALTIPTLCLEFKSQKLSLKRNHNYYYQIQGQLHIAQREACYFVVFVNDKTPLFKEVIYRDDDFWDRYMVEKLCKFYKTCILPELHRPRKNQSIKAAWLLIPQRNNEELLVRLEFHTTMPMYVRTYGTVETMQVLHLAPNFGFSNGNYSFLLYHYDNSLFLFINIYHNYM